MLVRVLLVDFLVFFLATNLNYSNMSSKLSSFSFFSCFLSLYFLDVSFPESSFTSESSSSKTDLFLLLLMGGGYNFYFPALKIFLSMNAESPCALFDF